MQPARNIVHKTEQQGKMGAGRDGGWEGPKNKPFWLLLRVPQAGRGTITSMMTFTLMGDCEEGVRVCVYAGDRVAGTSSVQNWGLPLQGVYFSHPMSGRVV